MGMYVCAVDICLCICMCVVDICKYIPECVHAYVGVYVHA